MKIRKLLVLLPLLSSLGGCGKSVPQEKAVYVGEWQDKAMYLLITQDGSVKYKRLKEGGTTSVEGPLKASMETISMWAWALWRPHLSSANHLIKWKANGKWSSMGLN